MTVRPGQRACGGFALIALIALVAAGVLYFVVGGLAPAALEGYRTRHTQESLGLAREALIGYAIRYRDVVDVNSVYGYLPLPDLGTSQNNNVSCTVEGCDAGNFAGNGNNVTVIGRFPWRTLGTAPLRDGHGECLWLIVSGSHQRVQHTGLMNWDTLGQLDVVAANGSASLVSLLTSAHDRPIAVVFSSGPPLPGQNRSASTTDNVGQCGGNYDVANYLDPDVAGALGAVTNFFGSPPNNASDPAPDPSMTVKVLSAQGTIHRRDDNTLWPSACPAGDNCTVAANDSGLTLTADTLFDALRKSSSFRTDINSMLDRMVGCLRDQIAAGGTFVPDAITGYAPQADKSAGRIPNNSCYDDTKAPLGYFAHWRGMFLVAAPTTGVFSVTDTRNTADPGDDTNQSCAGALIFAGQRGAGQSRAVAAEQSLLANYLEGTNLASFIAPGLAFSGPSQFNTSASGQVSQQDIVRCIPGTASFLEVLSPALSPAQQLVDYDPGTRTLTLGRENVTTGAGAPGGALFGCAWTPEADSRGNGFRAYFTFRFKQVGTSVGDNGFVFAAVDAESNTTQVCGAAGSHLGYSGNNGVTPPLTFPKIGIEFDQGRNAGFSELALIPGRNDPCGTSGCGGTVGYNSHAAIVYWGHETASAADGVTRPGSDDNVHGFPRAGSQIGNPRPAPQNPGDIDEAPAGIAFANMRGQAGQDVDGDGGSDSYLYHVRVELTPSRNVAAAANLSNSSVLTQVWIERDSDTTVQLRTSLQNTTRAMAQLSPGYAARLSDTATVYDVAGAACGGGCPQNQVCGTDNICYRQALKSLRLGFTGSQRTQDQQVLISNFFASWLQ